MMSERDGRNPRFIEWQLELLDSIFELKPDLGSTLGWIRYDDRLPEATRSAIRAFHRLLDEALERMERRFPVSELSREDRLDTELFRWWRELMRFHDLELESWKRGVNPGEYVGGLVFVSLKRIRLLRDPARAAQACRALAARLSRMREHLDQSFDLVERPVRKWLEEDIESIPSVAALVRNLEQVCRGALEEAGVDAGEAAALAREAGRAGEAAAEALQVLSRKLETLLPSATEREGIGPDEMEELLRKRRLPSGDELIEWAEEQIRLTSEQISEEGARLTGKRASSYATYVEAMKETASERRDFAALLESYRRASAECLRFLRESGFVRIPPGAESMEIIETPSYLEAFTPMAAYFPPEPFIEEDARRGVYMVTRCRSEEQFKEHYPAMMYNICVHEAYPGHHLQLTAALAASSPLRHLASGDEFIEGWAHYCEEAVVDEGFAPDEWSRLAQLWDKLVRLARIVIDVKVQRLEMTREDAVRYLHELTGMCGEVAAGELRWYVRAPSYPLSYATGKKHILELQRRAAAAGVTPRRFRDALLDGGNLPMWAHERRLEAAGVV